MSLRNYLEELKRRHVFRSGLAYLVVAWMIIQVASIILPTFGAAPYMMKTMLIILIIGFPVYLILAWIYDITPEGIKKTESGDSTSRFAPHISRRLNRVIIGALSITVILLLFNQFRVNPFGNFQEDGRSGLLQTESGTNEKSIAVLPFVNMSGDPEQEYFSDGMTEEIINALVQIRDLKVSGRTSSFYFKGKDVKLSTIGEELNVSTILEGSVQKFGDRLRITVQLINAADEYHIWSERYDRKLDDLFSLQDDISSRIAEKMKITLAGEKGDSLARIPTRNIEAYELVLRARYFREKGVEGYEKALECLLKAIGKDSTYAQAYGELATTYFLLGVHKFVSPEEGFGKMLEYGAKAVELDPNLPYRHLGMAYFHFWVTWDWNEALAEYEKELALGSPPSMFHPMFITYMYGQFDEAIDEAELIRQSDPLNIDLLKSLAEIYQMAGRYEEARTILNKILELQPSYSEAFRLIGTTHLSERDYDRAMEYFEKASEIAQGKSGYTTTGKIITLTLSGQKEKAERLFAEVQADTSRQLFAFEVANIYHCFGDINKTFEWLERAYENREFWLVSLNVDPGWDALRGDERFVGLVEKMGFPELK